MQCSQIIDLTTYMPMNNQKAFFLDTNVLYWFTYPRFGIAKKYEMHRAAPYYDFIDRLVSNGNLLFTSIYNITEMVHVIEKNELDIYRVNHPEADWSIKDLRKIPNERSLLKNNMSTALTNVKNICTILNFNFTYDLLDQFISELEQHRCDTFDYAILRNCINENIVNVISDDNDFSTMEQITLYTANTASLSAIGNLN